METASTRITFPSEVRQLREDEDESGRHGEKDRGDRVDFGRKALADRRVDLDRQRAHARRREKIRDDELVERYREGEEGRGDDTGEQERQGDREEGLNRRRAETH